MCRHGNVKSELARDWTHGTAFETSRLSKGDPAGQRQKHCKSIGCPPSTGTAADAYVTGFQIREVLSGKFVRRLIAASLFLNDFAE